MKKYVTVIGSGFSGLASAAILAKNNYEVSLLEKNKTVGGRARHFKTGGFTFDMGPSWYWMPDVFESFFNSVGKSTTDYYDLIRLDPSYRIFHRERGIVDIPARFGEIKELFESIEPGSASKLEKYLDEAAYKYQAGMQDLVFKSGKSLLEFADMRVLSSVFRLNMFQSIHKYIRNYFKDPFLIQLLEFPVLFLGAKPDKTPALYSLMNYADMKLGTWYPKGGMLKVIEAMENIAREAGVNIKTNWEVNQINVRGNRAFSLSTKSQSIETDAIVGSADYEFIDQNLLAPEFRNYSPTYWDKRSMSPSALIFYLGIDKKIDGLQHHNLFFDEPFDQHADAIYTNPKWPENPLFYVCCPSRTDESVAPEGYENLFVLIPVASGLNDNEETREQYFEAIVKRIEEKTGTPFMENIVFKKSYAHNNFTEDYHAFKGNAYGLANTLRQTAVLKPRMHARKVKNLVFAGQLTVPGPGVPPSLISGQVAAREIMNILS